MAPSQQQARQSRKFGSAVDISHTQAPSCLKTFANSVVLSFRTRGCNSSSDASLIVKHHCTQDSLPSHTALKSPLEDGSASLAGVWIRGITTSFDNFNLNLCVVTYWMVNIKKVITCVCGGAVNSEKFQQSLKLGTSWNDGLGYFPQERSSLSLQVCPVLARLQA